MNLQEQISRIQSMMWINESMSKKEFLFSYLDKNGFDSKPLKKILSIDDDSWSKYIKEYLGDDYEKIIENDIRKIVKNFTECNGDVFGLELESIFFGTGTRLKDITYTINVKINPDSPVFETIDFSDFEDVSEVPKPKPQGIVSKSINLVNKILNYPAKLVTQKVYAPLAEQLPVNEEDKSKLENIKNNHNNYKIESDDKKDDYNEIIKKNQSLFSYFSTIENKEIITIIILGMIIIVIIDFIMKPMKRKI